MPFEIVPPPANTPFIENNSISPAWIKWLSYLQRYINQASTELQAKLEKLSPATKDNIPIIESDGNLKDGEKSLPAGDLVGDTDTQELSNKTLNKPTIGDFSNATHDHTSDPEGGLIEGGGSSTLAGLTDTEITGPEINDLLQWDGTDWVDRTAEEAGLMTGLGEESKTGSVETTDNTPTDLIAIDLAEGKTMTIEAWITGRKSDGSKNASYHISGAFYRNTGGNVTQEGVTQDVVAHDSSDWSIDFYVDTGNQRVNVRVTGSTGDTVDWKAKAVYTQVAS